MTNITPKFLVTGKEMGVIPFTLCLCAPACPVYEYVCLLSNDFFLCMLMTKSMYLISVVRFGLFHFPTLSL